MSNKKGANSPTLKNTKNFPKVFEVVTQINNSIDMVNESLSSLDMQITPILNQPEPELPVTDSDDSGYVPSLILALSDININICRILRKLNSINDRVEL
jgi:hypothetical protein